MGKVLGNLKEVQMSFSQFLIGKSRGLLMIILEDKGRATPNRLASFNFLKLDLCPILDLLMDVKVGIRRRGTYVRKELKS